MGTELNACDFGSIEEMDPSIGELRLVARRESKNHEEGTNLYTEYTCKERPVTRNQKSGSAWISYV